MQRQTGRRCNVTQTVVATTARTRLWSNVPPPISTQSEWAGRELSQFSLPLVLRTVVVCVQIQALQSTIDLIFSLTRCQRIVSRSRCTQHVQEGLAGAGGEFLPVYSKLTADFTVHVVEECSGHKKKNVGWRPESLVLVQSGHADKSTRVCVVRLSCSLTCRRTRPIASGNYSSRCGSRGFHRHYSSPKKKECTTAAVLCV